MTDKEKICEEIEKIKTVHSSVDLKESNPDILVIQVCTNLLSFINSLPEEPVSEELEKAANEWDAKASFTPFYMTLDDKGNPNGVRQDYTTHAESFKAGANWEREQIAKENMLLPFKEYDNLMESINKRKKEGYEAGYIASQQGEKELIDKAVGWIGEIYNYHEIMRYSDSYEPPLSELTEWFKNYMKEENINSK